MTRSRTWIVVAAVASVLGLAVAAILIAGRFGSDRDDDGLAAALEWARLVAVPESAQDVRVIASGGAFTRTIEVRFVAAPSDVATWLEQSPGTRETEPSTSNGVRHFDIEPGGGANAAFVEVTEATGAVLVYASWS
jgi:hypothetical protein